MSPDQPRRPLLDTLEDTLDLLGAYHPETPTQTATPLPSLLQQCEELCASGTAPPVRLLHHFACSGGTVMSKCVAALPSIVLLSEIDPLSKMRLKHPDRFAPTDLLLHLRRSPRPVSEAVLGRVFQAGLTALHEELTMEGQTLVLRDHAHSQFCTDEIPSARPTLHALCAEVLPVRAVVTLRHPLDAFLSLDSRKWRHFDPFTLEEYARRVTAFLERHDGVPVVFYEDFAADPAATLQQICGHLDLPYSALAMDLLPLFELSGDSGRSGGPIATRTRRQIPDEIEAQRHESPAYTALCARFGYEV